jgi:hypothetical protein
MNLGSPLLRSTVVGLLLAVGAVLLPAQAPPDHAFTGTYRHAALPASPAVVNACDMASTFNYSTPQVVVDNFDLALPIFTATGKPVQIAALSCGDDDFPFSVLEWAAGGSSERTLHFQYGVGETPVAVLTADVTLGTMNTMSAAPSLETVSNPLGGHAGLNWGTIKYPCYFVLDPESAAELVNGVPYNGNSVFCKLAPGNTPLYWLGNICGTMPGTSANKVVSLAINSRGAAMFTLAPGSPALTATYQPNDPLYGIATNKLLIYVPPGIPNPTGSGVISGVPQIWGDVSLPEVGAGVIGSLRIYDPLSQDQTKGTYELMAPPGSARADREHITINGSVGSGDHRVAAAPGSAMTLTYKLPALAPTAGRYWIMYVKYTPTGDDAYEIAPGVPAAFNPQASGGGLAPGVLPVAGNLSNEGIIQMFGVGYALPNGERPFTETSYEFAGTIPNFDCDYVYQIIGIDFVGTSVAYNTSTALELNVRNRIDNAWIAGGQVVTPTLP